MWSLLEKYKYIRERLMPFFFLFFTLLTMYITIKITNFTVRKPPLLVLKSDGTMSVKLNVEGGTFGVQLVSNHTGMIEYILQNFTTDTVHSVEGNRSID